jgi:hypothetical protein
MPPSPFDDAIRVSRALRYPIKVEELLTILSRCHSQFHGPRIRIATVIAAMLQVPPKNHLAMRWHNLS